jgi:ethanolamine utilization protein EutN
VRLGRIIGSVVCTRKDEALEGVKLLLLEPIDETLAPAGDPLVACDTMQAGPGDVVLYEAGREAALALPNWFNTSDATVMAIVDRVAGGAST